jgi:serine/threonine protein kinase
MGITVIEMICGEPPYLNDDQIDIYRLIVINGKPKINEENLSRMSNEHKHFVLDRCLEVDPAKRADTSELLAHPFLKQAQSVDILIPIITLVGTKQLETKLN